MTDRDFQQAVMGATGVDAATAIRLTEAVQPLWAVMDELGWCDGFGGAESQRVFPEALKFIHKCANVGPFEDVIA